MGEGLPPGGGSRKEVSHEDEVSSLKEGVEICEEGEGETQGGTETSVT